jgi:rare lipoprotein A (peptidoglycan hydrolase)
MLNFVCTIGFKNAGIIMDYFKKGWIFGLLLGLVIALVVPDAAALVIPGTPEYESHELDRERPSYYREGRFIYSTVSRQEPDAREIRMSYPSKKGQTGRKGSSLERARQKLETKKSISHLQPGRPAPRTIQYRNPSRSLSDRRGPTALRIPGRDYSAASRPTSTYVVASWYGWDFHGRKTANGETYNMYEHTAAHKTLPFGTVLRVTNLRNGREAVVRINDRGPFVRGRDIDLSYATARELGMLDSGIERVRLEILPG